MAHRDHKGRAKAPVAVRVITCSDSRTPDTDTSGRLIRTLLEADGHRILDACIVADEPERIAALLKGAVEDRDTQAVILNGGTGISARDSTYEVVARMLDKRIDGFGELFRALSYAEIGSPAMMSRAIAGVARGCLLISVPGSESAVRLAMEKLILPELRHMAWLLLPATE